MANRNAIYTLDLQLFDEARIGWVQNADCSLSEFAIPLLGGGLTKIEGTNAKAYSGSVIVRKIIVTNISGNNFSFTWQLGVTSGGSEVKGSTTTNFATAVFGSYELAAPRCVTGNVTSVLYWQNTTPAAGKCNIAIYGDVVRY